MGEQLDLRKEEGWRFDQRPELQLAYKGLQISINAGKMTQEQAEAMLKSWEEPPQPTED